MYPDDCSLDGHQKANQVRQELVSMLDLTPTFLAAAGAESVSNLPGSSLEPLLLTEAVSGANICSPSATFIRITTTIPRGQ